MAIRIKNYWKTTDIDPVSLAASIKTIEVQENKVLQLYKKFGKLHKWDVFNLLEEIGHPIQSECVGRAIDSLKKAGSITYVGSVIGDKNKPVMLYEVTDIPFDSSKVKKGNKTIPKKLTININFREDGTVDEEQTIEVFIQALDTFINRHKL